jgi:hypothetical protein
MNPAKSILKLPRFRFTTGMAYIGHDGLQYRVTGLGRVDMYEVRELDLGDVRTLTALHTLIQDAVGCMVKTHRVDDGTYLVRCDRPGGLLSSPHETYADALYEALDLLGR